MKKFIVCLFVATLALSVSAWEYNECFDVEGNWTANGAMGSYNTKVYTNSSAPAGITFESSTCVRETTDYATSPYAWRINRADDTYWRFIMPEGPQDTLVSAVFCTADWDVSDNNEFEIRYSTDSGATYTTLLKTNASYYTLDGLGDKDYKRYETGYLGITPDAGKEVYLEVYNEVGDERILVDCCTNVIGVGVGFFGVPEPMLLGLLPLALLFLRRK